MSSNIEYRDENIKGLADPKSCRGEKLDRVMYGTDYVFQNSLSELHGDIFVGKNQVSGSCVQKYILCRQKVIVPCTCDKNTNK